MPPAIIMRVPQESIIMSLSIVGGVLAGAAEETSTASRSRQTTARRFSYELKRQKLRGEREELGRGLERVGSDGRQMVRDVRSEIGDERGYR
jgi:hypothetical protein